MSRINNESVNKTGAGILANLVEAENLKVTKKVLTDLNGTVETKVLEEAVEEKEEEVKEEATEEVKEEKKEDLKESVEPAQPEGAEDKVPGEGKEPLAEDEEEEIVDTEVLDEPVEDEVTEEPVEVDNIAKATELIAKIFGGEVTEEDREAARAELTGMIGGDADAEPIEGEDLPVEPEEEIVEEGATVCPKCKKENCECDKKDMKEEAEDKIEEKMVEGLKIVDVKNNAFLLKESAGFIVGKNFDKSTGVIEEAETYKTEKIAKKAFERLTK